MGMMTTATSFACVHGDVVHYEKSGIKEISNLHWIPPIYCSGCLPRIFFVGVGNVVDASAFSFGSFVLTVGVSFSTILGGRMGVVGRGTR